MAICRRRPYSNASPAINRASARFCAMLAKAKSISLLLVAVITSICIPMDEAAVCTSATSGAVNGLLGLTRCATRVAEGQKFMQEPEPLRPKLLSHEGDPSDVTSRPGEALNETLVDGIAAHAEHNGNCRSRAFAACVDVVLPGVTM